MDHDHDQDRDHDRGDGRPAAAAAAGLYYLTDRGAVRASADSRRAPGERDKYFAFEGDRRWRPLAELDGAFSRPSRGGRA